MQNSVGKTNPCKTRRFDILIIISLIFDISLGLFSFVMPFLRLPAIAATSITVILLIFRLTQMRSGQKIITKLSKQIIKEPKMKKIATKLKNFFKFFFTSNPKTMCAILPALAFATLILTYQFTDLSWDLWLTILLPSLGAISVIFASWIGFESNKKADARRHEKRCCQADKCYVEKAKEILNQEKAAQQKQIADIEAARIQQIVAQMKQQEQQKQMQNQEKTENTEEAKQETNNSHWL